jgi:hypothetical protein
MIDEADDRRTQGWARLTGLLLVLTNLSAMFAHWVLSQIMVGNDAAATAANMAASETFVRVGLAAELVTIAGVIPLIVGLYLILRPVGRDLALLALSWRLVENCVLAALAFASFTAVTLAAGGPFMAAADPRETEAYVYALMRVHTWGFQFGFLFLGLGQILFSYLWWRSRYVPRWLAGLGMLASSLLAVMALGIIVWPPLLAIVTMAYMAPMAIYEIGLGLWLLVKGIHLAATD